MAGETSALVELRFAAKKVMWWVVDQPITDRISRSSFDVSFHGSSFDVLFHV